MRRQIGTLFVLFGLAACSGGMCPERDEFEQAVRYPVYSNKATGWSEHRLPFDAWVNNPDLEVFLRKAIAAGGAESLVSSYGFQCSPQQMAALCADCYSCKRTVPQAANRLSGLGKMCVSQGDMLVRVEVGPGSTLNAMTYWQADAETRRNWTR